MLRNLMIALSLGAVLFCAREVMAQDPTTPPRQDEKQADKKGVQPAPAMAFVEKSKQGEEWLYIMLTEEQVLTVRKKTEDADDRNKRIEIELEQPQLDAVNAAIGGKLKEDDIELMISRQYVFELPNRKGFFIKRKLTQFQREDPSDTKTDAETDTVPGGR